MKVSVLQFKPWLHKKTENIEQLTAMLKGLNTDLVVLPELAVSGYVFAEKKEPWAMAEEAGKGEAFLAFIKAAREGDFSLVYGFPELCRDKLYNSSALINPDGSFAIYRKIHLFNREKLFFTPGDKPFAVHNAKHGVKIGMMICFDWQFPEAARCLALAGAQIICHPANLVLPWCQQAMKLRSLENRVFTITANRIGQESNGEFSETFTGRSQILDTHGELLVSLGLADEGIRTVEIEPEVAWNKQVSELNDAFQDRRPEMYGGLR